MRAILLAGLLMITALSGCNGSAEDGAVVDLKTNFGTITVELFMEQTPVTAGNFYDLAQDGFYDGTKFHRIITDFMMQGGDPNSKDDDPSDDGRGGPGYSIPDEFHPDLKHDRPYLLSMANSGPNTGGSQFFITFAATPWLDGKHAIFGEVIKGRDVVDRINAEASTPQGVPTAKTVILESIEVSAYERPAPTPAEVAADAITPGAFHVSNTTDHILVWARNTGQASTSVAWSLTGADGGALPAGWSAAFDDPQQELRGGSTVRTMLRLTVDALAEGTHDLMLHAGNESTPLTLTMDGTEQRVSKAGDRVELSYDGRCTQDNQDFDAGQFSTPLGSGETVPGFDFGLMGLTLEESATLVLPFDLAYGANGGPCAGKDIADLTFDVSILAFQ